MRKSLYKSLTSWTAPSFFLSIWNEVELRLGTVTEFKAYSAELDESVLSYKLHQNHRSKLYFRMIRLTKIHVRRGTNRGRTFGTRRRRWRWGGRRRGSRAAPSSGHFTRGWHASSGNNRTEDLKKKNYLTQIKLFDSNVAYKNFKYVRQLGTFVLFLSSRCK